MGQLSISQEAVPKKTIRSTVKTMSSNNDMVLKQIHKIIHCIDICTVDVHYKDA